jgi:hypothetical protein
VLTDVLDREIREGVGVRAAGRRSVLAAGRAAAGSSWISTVSTPGADDARGGTHLEGLACDNAIWDLRLHLCRAERCTGDLLAALRPLKPTCVGAGPSLGLSTSTKFAPQ